MHLVGVGPNEVIDLATLNLTVMQYCITRRIMMSFPKIGAHYSQIILNSFATYYSQFQHNLQRPSDECLCHAISSNRIT